MKIKRFEASSMSEALRQIKKEFGEEAVILSAKTNKKSQRFLSKNNTPKVVVTAAIDKKSNASPKDAVAVADKGHQHSANTENGPNKNTKNLGSSIFKQFNPITKTGQKILKPRMAQQMAAPEEKPIEKVVRKYYQRLIEAGLSKDIAAEWDEQMRGLLGAQDVGAKDIQQALSQAIQAKSMVGSLHRTKPGQPKCVVLMGPAGVGKTSAVAKLAAKQALGHTNSVAIISVDNQRVAGSIELERFAKIMGVPFETAFSTHELKEKLNQLTAYALVLIDTPGISSTDPLQREKLRKLLDAMDNAEHLLVLNGALQEKATARIIDYFRPLNVHSLFYTSLDWASDPGVMINQSVTQKLPIGYLSQSPKIPEGLQMSSADFLAGLIIAQENEDDDIDDNDFQPISFVKKQRTHNAPYYVANRNSDIFHFHECNAVKRINSDNMIVFKDPAEAMGQQFKPCRMCCSELIVPKPLDRLVRGYAGNRC